MTILRGFFIFFCSCLSLSGGKALEDDACVGMRRGEEYDFDLPDAVAKNVQIDSCDAEWSVDMGRKCNCRSLGHAISRCAIHSNPGWNGTINFTLPFKNVTTYGISVKMNFCPVSVKYHVSCHVYTRSLTCSCMNNTKESVSSTTPPSTDTPWSFGYKRNHYAAFAVYFGCICLILIFIWRTNGVSAAEQNQTDSSV